MLFNDNDELSFKDIQTSLQTEELILKMMLDSLALKKYKVLLNLSGNKSISVEDTFKVNDKFKSKFKQLTVVAPVIKETFNKEKIDIDRTHTIEAAIVKIMKSRKKMTYMNLSQEVMIVLQMFKPTAAIIKGRIECLIEREFLERDSKDSQILRYLA